MIAKIGASTEREAFIAHAQGINALFLWEMSLMPIGRGRPIRNPIGNIAIDTAGILAYKPSEAILLNRRGWDRL